MSAKRTLLEQYPKLAERIPVRVLADLPTPVERLAPLEEPGGPALWVKRDDLTSEIYGGNKTRKLELILGKLAAFGQKRVLTFGFAGSNHAAATALFCEPLGIECTSMLMPQPPSRAVRENLLLGHARGARLKLYPGLKTLILGAVIFRTFNRGRLGSMIPMISAGGTTPEGNTAFVNAAFELAAQVADGACPEPDAIYVAAGSLGTAAGLIAGVKAAGLATEVIPVGVTEQRFANSTALAKEVCRTLRFLRRRDPSFPRVEITPANAVVGGGYLGERYGLFTAAGAAAMETARERAGMALEGTYTAKAFACFLDAAMDPTNEGKNLMFWNTANSADISERVASVDYRELPEEFHHYFTDPVQPLDRAPDS